MRKLLRVIKRDTSSSNISHSKPNKGKRLDKRSVLVIVFGIYLTFILLSQIPLFAENLIDTSEMDDSYEYHLSFPTDGKTGHYYVERYDTSQLGRIHVIYSTESNSLEVECTNIKVLKIYCRQMYEKKSEEVLKRNPALDSNYYKTYFIERDHFHVHVFTKLKIQELAFIDTPIPYNVSVNGREWWLTGINYTYADDGLVLTKVPLGHSYVDVFFKSNDKNSPLAGLTASKTLVGVGETITFNASSSYDPDGKIESYVWDLGDGSYKGGEIIDYAYTEEGNYGVILTVTDDDDLVARAYVEITVVSRIMDISISVDKPIASPGSVLVYSITPTINVSWKEGVRDIMVTDILRDDIDYLDATPIPILENRTVTWRLGSALDSTEIPQIKLRATIKQSVENNTIISNYGTLSYKGIDNQQFPLETSNSVITKINIGSFNTPRIKEKVPDVQLAEDDPPFNLFLTPFEYDNKDKDENLKWFITGENESLYIVSGEYSDYDLLTITPIPDAYGTSLVTLWLEDSEGYTTNQPLWINITPVNDPPTFSIAPDLIIHYEEAYTFDYEPYIYDIDTPINELQLFARESKESILDSGNSSMKDSGSGSRANIQVNKFKVTYSYPRSYSGKQVIVSLIVSDGSAHDGDVIQVNITDDYTPILKQELPDVWLEEGEILYNVFDLDEYFDDPDRDSLFYSFGDTHVEVMIQENHSVDISSLSEWHGVDTITFRARDPIGAIAEDTIFITVIPVNDPPIIEGVTDTFYVHYDADYSFDLAPYISDNDNKLEDLFLLLDDDHIRTAPMNRLKIILNYPKTLLGKYVPVKLVVSDGIATGAQDVTVKVTDNWPPDLDRGLPDISFNEDETLDYTFNLNDYFSDKDSNTLYYSYGQKNINIIINSNGSVSFSAMSNWNGVERVTFRATDPTHAFAESIITVTVMPVNDPPIIKRLPNQIGTIKELLKFDLTNYISDVDNSLNELEITITSEQLDILVNGRELVVYSDTPVKENVTIMVSDGSLETLSSLLIEIRDDEDGTQSDIIELLMSILWVLIIIIITIVIITGYASYRKYVGNYHIEDIFWIYNDGLLISHITSNRKKHGKDDDLMSGMLTGILNISSEVFSENNMENTDEKAGGIKEIQMHDKNILIDRGTYTFLATVFTGRSGKRLYSSSNKALDYIEMKYKRKLDGWSGDMANLKGARKSLRKMLIHELYNQSKSKK